MAHRAWGVVITIPLILLGSCGTIPRDGVITTRAIYSEAGGMASVFSGNVSSCTVVESSTEQRMVVRSMQFGEDKCEITLSSPEHTSGTVTIPPFKAPTLDN